MPSMAIARLVALETEVPARAKLALEEVLDGRLGRYRQFRQTGHQGAYEVVQVRKNPNPEELAQ